MNDDQRLSLLDRRAAAATAALDEAVQQVPVPEPDLGAPRRSVRRFLPLAVAAGLAIIALVGAALVFDDDEQSTIAEQPGGITRLALPDPESLGYRVVGAFDPDSAPAPPPGLDLTMTIHTPVDADEPWETTVVSWAIPAELSTLHGETVDVGGPQAALQRDGQVVSVGWMDGGDVRYVRSADIAADELVGVVRRAVEATVAAGQALPGHRIVHTAQSVDVYPVAAIGVTTGDLGGVAYESDRGVLVVATTAGSDARWKASSALAVHTEPLIVRGHDAVRADFGEGMTEISWLEANGTLVRVSSHSGSIPVDVLDELEPISDADFAALIDEHGTGNEGEVIERHVEGGGEEIEAPEPILPDGGSPSTTMEDRERLAEVRAEVVRTDNGRSDTVHAVLVRARSGFEFETFSGHAASGRTVPDLSTSLIVREVLRLDTAEIHGELLGGIIGPDIVATRIVDATTGEHVEGNGPSTATIEGSDHVVFLATVGPEYRNHDLVVIGTRTTGEEFHLNAPAR